MDFLKELPYSADAEMSVIGSILIDSFGLNLVFEKIKTDDFYLEKNREIFRSVTELFNQDSPVDIVTVSNSLINRGVYEAVGGKDYLIDAVNSVPTTQNILMYAEIIREKASLRRLITASKEIENMCYDTSNDIESVKELAVQKIFDVVQDKNSGDVTHISSVIYDNYQKLSEIAKNGIKISGIPTGFIDLDEKIFGLNSGNLILIAARPSMGKTAFALNIAQNVAIRQKVPVAFFSLEMSKEELVNRIISSEAKIEGEKIRKGNISEKDLDRFLEIMDPLSKSPFYVDDTSSVNITELRAKCKRLKIEKKIGLVVIDYLQLMQGRKSENRQQEVSDISRSLKILAKELQIPIITLSQLSREPEKRADKKPFLSDLRESGAIEQDADIVMFLYRDEYYNPASDKKNIAECIISKNRNGSTGEFEMAFLKEFTLFADLERTHNDYR